MVNKKGWCPKHKRIVKAITKTDCSSLFCKECSGYTKLIKKPNAI